MGEGGGRYSLTDHKKTMCPSLIVIHYQILKNCNDAFFVMGRYECISGDIDQFTLRLN